MAETDDRAPGSVVNEAAYVPGTDVVTSLVAARSRPLRVGDAVTAEPQGALLVVEEILYDCFIFEVLEPDTEGRVVLRGPSAGNVAKGNVLTLAGL